MSSPPTPSTRRHFLQMAVVSATLPVLLRCASKSEVGPESVGKISAGNISALPVGTVAGIGQEPVCIGRDDTGVYAMTLICPHEGCDMSNSGTVDASGVYCACHGSRFDPNGAVTAGPAESDLQHFEVSVDASGELSIDTDKWVDAATRFPV